MSVNSKQPHLQPVTFPAYQQGRIIQFDGSTEDHEVFAALEDLKVYCEEQLKECKDTLALMNDRRHFLDIYHVSWRIVARGFKTPSIRFEFDRKRMFEILSDQIYQGNPYVFLRELLQNSIDAIRMRRKVLARHKIDAGELGTIRATIEHMNNGDVNVTWTDDGVGMDEYIARNFLAVAGKSYYSSKEFEQLGLTFDPVSKFGIGILSCFLVADRIEIETRRDSYLSPNGIALNICIPDVEKHFRIEYGKATAPFGTCVKVFVRGDKVRALFKDTPSFTFQGTEYLTRIAGFVEFPLVVTEYNQTVVILHPERTLPKHLEEVTKAGAVLRKLDLGLSIEEYVVPQDVAAARKYLREERISIARDLRLAGYEGSISFLVPNSNDLEWDNESLIRHGKPRKIEANIRNPRYFQKSEIGIPQEPDDSSVFCNGILVVRDQSEARRYRSPFRSFQRTLANLTSSLKAEIDVSRSNLIGESRSWSRTVREGLIKYFGKTWISEAMGCAPEERLRLLARSGAHYDVSTDEIWSVCPQERWPIPLLGNRGKLVVKEWGEVKSQHIPVLPRLLRYEVSKLAWNRLFSDEPYRGPLELWNGGLAVIDEYDWFSDNVPHPDFVARLQSFCDPVIKGWTREIRFLLGPWKKGPDIVQELLIAPPPMPAGAISNTLDKELRHIAAEAEALPVDGLAVGAFRKEFGNNFTLFPPPHERAFAYGWKWFNLNHPVVKQVIRLWAIQEVAKLENKLTSAQQGALNDVENPFSDINTGGLATKPRVQAAQKNIDKTCNLLTEFGLLSKTEPPIHLPGKAEFVPGTHVDRERKEGGNPFHRRLPERKFGQPLE